MIKRTLQEWADFTGCYIAMDANDYVYAYTAEPLVHNKFWEGAPNYSIPDELVNTENHDWKNIVSPPKTYKNGDLVFAWDNTTGKACMPDTVYYKGYFDGVLFRTHLVSPCRDGSLCRSRDHVLEYNPEYAGLTIGELEGTK